MVTAEQSLERGILAELPLGIYVMNAERKITFWNREASRLTGYPEKEVVGRSCSDDLLRHALENGTVLCGEQCPMWKTIQDGHIRESLVYLHHRDGQRMPVQVKILPFQVDGKPAALHVFNATTAMLAAQEEIRRLQSLALTDALTGLPNRRYFEMEYERFTAEARREGRRFGLLMLDIDRFKRVNDAYGHPAGDVVLKMVAQTCLAACRTSDIMARWGGEEFAALCHVPDAAGLRVVAERARCLTEQSFVLFQDQRVSVTLSAGGVMADSKTAFATLQQQADQLLYQSKTDGRNRVTVPAEA
jgi:diguanylate cyclase (GGDEF)-like protein/PAS domain S-box-containing protein